MQTNGGGKRGLEQHVGKFTGTHVLPSCVDQLFYIMAQISACTSNSIDIQIGSTTSIERLIV